MYIIYKNYIYHILDIRYKINIYYIYIHMHVCVCVHTNICFVLTLARNQTNNF